MERNRRIAPQAGSSDAVASRLTALEALAAAADAGRAGPLLLTGEPGAGKTWLRRRLVEALPPGWGAAVVEVGPVIDAVDFLTLAAAKLGVSPLPDRPATLRLAVEKALGDESCEGRLRLLVVEDAHHASPEVWAEVEALCDRLGEPGGFAAALIVGRSELTRRMGSQPLRAMASRFSKHLHLPPLDMDETARLLPGVGPGELELLHRDAAGNPRRLLALAGERLPRSAVAAPVAEAPLPPPSLPARKAEPAPAPPAQVVPHPGAPKVEIPIEPRQSPPALLPSRPPLRIEEGLIEVGWAGSLEAEEATDIEDFDEIDHADGDLIDDHYAALQAWSEWARNRDRLSRPAVEAEAEAVRSELDGVEGELEEAPAPEVDDEAYAESDDNDDAEACDEPDGLAADFEEESPIGDDLRAEPPHEHAPYGQLFGRMRLSS